MDVAAEVKRLFLETIWEYYRGNGRHDLPWRLAEPDGTFDPYKILVSELMLQQTQVSRVIPKFDAFIAQFPTAEALAGASLGDVLRAWQGLGYNRRAKFLWESAKQISASGQFPNTLESLVALPGVGVNTAGAVLAYAYNEPVVFIETNIRTVYIHHFFSEQDAVSDADIRELVEQTLDAEQPREFYWALMDYGSYLKTQTRNNKQSKHYTKQSAFAGSRREIRGLVLRELSKKDLSLEELTAISSDKRLPAVLEDLLDEKIISQKHNHYSID
ncbi:A/G-specific adenine glycosylase [Candidatus Saccharibacteria bacterium]|nr:A/G-specific adenine glycosylase [Candidatus Saccharibacteria bacterium]